MRPPWMPQPRIVVGHDSVTVEAGMEAARVQVVEDDNRDAVVEISFAWKSSRGSFDLTAPGTIRLNLATLPTTVRMLLELSSFLNWREADDQYPESPITKETENHHER